MQINNTCHFIKHFSLFPPVKKVILVILTYSLTPCSKVLLEKLPGSQLVKEFPAFCGTPRFITALTGACHLSLS